MRKNIVAGNWKMNLNLQDGQELVQGIQAHLEAHPVSNHHQVIICPPLPYIHPLAHGVNNSSLSIGAQNMHQAASGAFTGETSVQMLEGTGASYVLIGHSERRQYFNETNALLKEKLDAALQSNLKVIFCCGETLETREAGAHFEFVENQLKESLFHIDAKHLDQVVVAYEPIWAIGTGVTASSDQADEMHAHIRKAMGQNFSLDAAEELTILYGGSVKPANARELFSKEHVDGGLVGGASLKLADFSAIIDAL